MKIGVVIPARYNSTRFPGKPLADICGKPMIQHVYERAGLADRVTQVLVATDDERVYETVSSFGGSVVMTSADISSGTDRVRCAVERRDWDIVINVQGDEPLIIPGLIDTVASVFEVGEAVIATVASENSSWDDFQDSNVVKVVRDLSGNALYFSRSPIPFMEKASFRGFLRHVGIYGFRRDTLLEMGALRPSQIEKMESLEQLRWMDYGYDIKVLKVEYQPIGVDTPRDLDRVRVIMSREG